MSLSHARVIPRSRPAWVTAITPDAIQHFAWGIGDNNPHWLDGSPGGVPPCIYFAVDETTVAPNHDDLGRFYQLADWTWFDQPALGSEIISTATLIDETIDGAVINQVGRVDFTTAEGQIVASINTTAVRQPPTAAAIDERPEIRYDGTQLDAIEVAILAEQRRGGTPRFWTDTEVGDELGPLLKGPLSIMDVVAWCAGTQGVARPSDGYSDGGLHAETATGPQQVSWLSQVVTDWMGDDAFLHRLEVTLVANPPLGSTTTLTGSVTGLWFYDRLPLAAVDLVATSQADEITATGRAMVVLPAPDQPSPPLPMSETVPWQSEPQPLS